MTPLGRNSSFDEYEARLLDIVTDLTDRDADTVFADTVPWVTGAQPDAYGPTFDFVAWPLSLTNSGATILSNDIAAIVPQVVATPNRYAFTFHNPPLGDVPEEWEGHNHYHSYVIRPVVFAEDGQPTGEGAFVTSYAVFLNRVGVIGNDPIRTANWTMNTLTIVRRIPDSGQWMPVRVAWQPQSTHKVLNDIADLGEPARTILTGLHDHLAAINASFEPA